MSMQDTLKQLDNWAQDYAKAIEDGVFEDSPKPFVPSTCTSDHSFFGPTNDNPSSEVRDVDAQYWNSVYDLTKSDPNADSGALFEKEQLLQEGATPEKYEKLKNHPSVKRVESPNPIDPETVGKDQRRHVTPNWTDGEELFELDNLKRSLYSLECRLSGPDGLREDSENQKVIEELEALKKKVDDLSNALIPAGWKDMES